MITVLKCSNVRAPSYDAACTFFVPHFTLLVLVVANFGHFSFIQSTISSGLYFRAVCIIINFSEAQTLGFIFESIFKSTVGYNDGRTVYVLNYVLHLDCQYKLK